MNLTSFGFLCFFAAALGLYYIIPQKLQWRFLLAVSIVYFLFSAEVTEGGWYVTLYPLAAVAAVYLAARLISRMRDQEKKRIVLVCALLFCTGLLCLLKFSGLPLLVPMGISFYTLTLLGYLFDVYYEIGAVQKNYGKLLLFGCYFPTMVSGPILRYREIEPRLFSGHRLDYRRITFGMQRMLWGFFKKLVISERLALISGQVFDHYTDYAGFVIWIGAVAFTLQLYTDFSGCMDIVLGVSQCFGIDLPENFRTPFFSASISEYWRRWHITLGSWLKEYLFYPLLRTRFFRNLPKRLQGALGKKRAKQATTFCALFVLWFAVGYWHGGTWHFIIGSGLLHWFYLVSGELLEPVFRRGKDALHIRGGERWFLWFQRLRTFLLVTVGLVFFRSATTGDALRMLGRGFAAWNPEIFVNGTLFTLGLEWTEWLIAGLSLLVLLRVSVLQQKGSVRERLERAPLPVRWAVLYALLFAVILLGQYGPGYDASEFIYQRFQV